MKKIIFLTITITLLISLAGTCLAEDTSASSTSDSSKQTFGQVKTNDPLIPTIVVPKTSEGKPSKLGVVAQLPASDWSILLANIIKFILAITGSLALISFTYGGVKMVTAQGKEDEIGKGKTVIFWSILALIIIAISYAIVVGITQLNFFQV